MKKKIAALVSSAGLTLAMMAAVIPGANASTRGFSPEHSGKAHVYLAFGKADKNSELFKNVVEVEVPTVEIDGILDPYYKSRKGIGRIIYRQTGEKGYYFNVDHDVAVLITDDDRIMVADLN